MITLSISTMMGWIMVLAGIVMPFTVMSLDIMQKHDYSRFLDLVFEARPECKIGQDSEGTNRKPQNFNFKTLKNRFLIFFVAKSINVTTWNNILNLFFREELKGY